MSRWDAYRLHLFRAGAESLIAAFIWTALTLFRIEVARLDPLELVLVGTVMEATIFLFEIPTGIVADVYSRRLSVLIGTAILALSYLMQGVWLSFGAILLAQVVWGLGWTFISGAYDAWLVDEIGPERAGEAFLRGTQISRLTGLVGIGLSVLLGSLSLYLPVLLGGLALLGLALWLALAMPETGFAPTPKGERSTWRQFFDTFRNGTQVIRTRPALLAILGVGLFVGLYSEAWDRLWQLHLLETIGLPGFIALPAVAWFGLLNIVTTLITVWAAGVARRRVDTARAVPLTRALVSIHAVMVGGLIAYGLAGSLPVALGAFFAFTTLRALAWPLLSAWSNLHIESSVRATVLSMQSQTDAIGQIVGGPPLGAIGRASLRLAFLASASLLAPTVPLLARARRLETVEEAARAAAGG